MSKKNKKSTEAKEFDILDNIDIKRSCADYQNDGIWAETKSEITKITDIIKDNPLDCIEIISKRYIDLYHKYLTVNNKLRTKVSNKEREFDIEKIVAQRQQLEHLSREFEKKYKQSQKEVKEQEILLKNCLEQHESEIKILKDIIDTQQLSLKFKQFLKEYDLKTKLYENLKTRKNLEFEKLNQKHIKVVEELEEKKITLLSKNRLILELNTSLAAYIEKFKEIEKNLDQSNELFMKFRDELFTLRDLDSKNLVLLLEKVKEERDFLAKELSLSESRNVYLEKKVAGASASGTKKSNK
jgi:hypothetical protein